MKIGVGVYVKDSPAAVALYQEAFGLELGYHVKNPDGTFYHSELWRDGVEVIDVVEAPIACTAKPAVQLCVNLESPADVERAFALLSDGGTVDLPVGPLPWSDCAASVIDRFGIWWYLSAGGHYPDADFDPAKPLTPDMA